MTLQEAIDTIDVFYGSPMSVMSDCLRGFLVPKPGYDFIACDFAAIEARVLAWLADEQAVLSIFDAGEDIYVHAAAAIYHVAAWQVTDAQRQVGKVAILALGFGGGVGAFQAMAKTTGVKVSDSEAEGIKLAWRAANQRIVAYWRQLETAAMRAVMTAGTVFTAGPVEQAVQFVRNGNFLWLKLPSRRVLCYPYPQIDLCTTPWGASKDTLTYMTNDSLTHKWGRAKTYGGSLAENVTQAVARDLLAEAMLRVESRNFRSYRIVLHVHDEIVCEVPKDSGSVEDLENIMKEVPVWASGLPMAAKGWRGERYRK